MKVILLFFLELIALQSMFAQELKMCGYQGYQTVEEVTSACDLQGASVSTNSSENAEIVVDNILDKVGLFRNFLIEECDNINNALAVTMPLEGGDIDRYILYDQAFFQKVSASTGTDWGLTSILAHEVGHHLNGHTLKGGGSNHKVELQADEFSGFVLARMKCSLEDAQSAVSKLLPDVASSTHPAKVDRLAAIELGWNRGNGKTIMVKKIEEVDDQSEITAEQVIANYLDAIGGQEKIMAIKTFSQKLNITSQSIGTGGKTNGEENRQMIFSTPNNLLETISMNSKKPISTLSVNNKHYIRLKPKKPWSLVKGSEKASLESKGVSYIPEFGALINNINMKLLRSRNINGKECFVIEFPEMEISRNSLTGVTSKQSTKFYDISTGLLYYEEYSMKTKSEGDNSFGKQLLFGSSRTSKKFYTDYRVVEGVLFSFRQEESIIDNTPWGDYKTEAVTEYSEIIVNPTIDPALFDPTK